MGSTALTTVRGGINRQRAKGAAVADSLYDLMNGYVTKARTVVVRPGTFRNDALPAGDTLSDSGPTHGLCSFRGQFHVFATDDVAVPDGYVLHILRHPDDTDVTLPTDIKRIHFAAPFMGSLYVVAEFEDSASTAGNTFHFWIQTGDEWLAETIYKIGDIITPEGSSISFRANRASNPNQVWSADAPRALNDLVEPTVYNGFQYRAVSVDGEAKSGKVEPTWPEVEGAQITETESGVDQAPASTADDDVAPPLPDSVVLRYHNVPFILNRQAALPAATVVVSNLNTNANAWKPGTLYAPGAVVRQASAPPVTNTTIVNPGFETGDLTGWTVGSGSWSNFPSGGAFEGSKTVKMDAGGTAGAPNYLEQSAFAPVNPGTILTAVAQVNDEHHAHGAGAVGLAWYTDADVLISVDAGNYSGDNHWRPSTVVATAPPTAAKVKLRLLAYSPDGRVEFDGVTWNHVYQPAVSALLYRAVQAVSGRSGATEPVWPAVSLTVVDNEVTWLAVGASQVIWQAEPIMKSGTVEPTWVEIPGATVSDNTIIWTATSGLIEDPRCPHHSKIVLMAASKIFAFDDDIIQFSATANPLDWSTKNDAGYLAFGLQAHGSTPGTALGLYRSNLVAFNSQAYQMWQVDEDPANMSLLDASPIDCPYFRTPLPVVDDLVFLSSRGLRSIGIAGASTNLQAGTFGAQVDPLVLEAIKALAEDEEPMSLFWPGAGQYWLIFGAEAFVLTLNGGPKDASFSRYVFPRGLTDWAIQGTNLYLRAGSLVWRVSEDAIYDDQISDTATGGNNSPFEGYLAWQYLDFGALGADKEMLGFDLVTDGVVRVSIGYDQKRTQLATPQYTINGDTLPGDMIPMPLTAPSYQFRLTYNAGQAWEWQATTVYTA